MDNSIDEYLEVVRDNIPYLRSLCGIDSNLYYWGLDEDSAVFLISGEFVDNNLPSKVCRKIKRFYGDVLGKEFGEDNIKVDCEYNLNCHWFELHIYEYDYE